MTRYAVLYEDTTLGADRMILMLMLMMLLRQERRG